MKNGRVRTYAVAGAFVVGALVGGSSGVANAAVPSPQAAYSAIATTHESTGALRAPGSPILASGVALPASPTGEQSTNGIPIGPVINWIKANASSIMTPMKNAVKNGFSSFKSWWNGLAGWIKNGINFIVNCSLTELFDALWHYFFG